MKKKNRQNRKPVGPTLTECRAADLAAMSNDKLRALRQTLSQGAEKFPRARHFPDMIAMVDVETKRRQEQSAKEANAWR